MLLAKHQSWNSSRDIFRQASQLLMNHWKPVAWLWVWLVAIFILYGFVGVVFEPTPVVRFLSNLLVLLMVLYNLVMSACLVYLASDRRGRSLRQVFRDSIVLKLPALAALALLVSIATVVATFAFVIPGIVLYTFWSMSIFVLLVENTSVRGALQRSVQLVRGWWWPVFGRFLFLFTLLTLQTLLGYVPVVGAVVSALVSLLLVPISIWYGYLTYKELVEIKEFKHMQQAQVPLAGKFLLTGWAVLILTLFVVASSGAEFVRNAVVYNPGFLPQNSEPWFFSEGKVTSPESLITPAVK